MVSPLAQLFGAAPERYRRPAAAVAALGLLTMAIAATGIDSAGWMQNLIVIGASVAAGLNIKAGLTRTTAPSSPEVGLPR